MPVWWGTFIYMMVVSALGMYIYKSRQERAIVGFSDGTNEKVINNSIGLFFALLSFALLVFFAGQRSYIFDSTDYQYAYENYYTTDLSQITGIWNGTIQGKGKMFMTILVLFKHFSGGADYNAWFTFLAIIESASVAYFFQKYSSNYIYSIFLFFTTSCFLWLINGIRQFLAVAVVLFFIKWFIERKTIPFLLVVIFAYYIHSTAIIWIPFYFIVNYKPWSRKFILLSMLTAIAILALSKNNVLEDTNYSYVLESTGGVSPFRIVVMAVPTIFAFCKRKEVEEKATPFIDLCVNMSIITTELYLVGMFTSGIMGRIPIYFQLFNYLLLPWLFNNFFEKKDALILILISSLCFLAYFCYDMYVAQNGVYTSIKLGIFYSFK